MVLSATLDEVTLTLNFNETLDSGVTLLPTAFAVSVSGAARSVNAVSVSGSAVTLTLASAPTPGEIVEVSYTRPDGTNIIRDTRGRIADSFSDQPATVTTEPLLAESQSVPASHDGSTAFTFRVHLTRSISDDSENTLADAFTVTGGAITGVTEIGSMVNDLYRISVLPSGNADVTVSLPATTDCTATGAICTSNGVRLTEGLTVTVPGPNSQNSPANTPAEGAPAITGTARVGETLTATTDGISRRRWTDRT